MNLGVESHIIFPPTHCGLIPLEGGQSAQTAHSPVQISAQKIPKTKIGKAPCHASNAHPQDLQLGHVCCTETKMLATLRAPF